eukprot:1203366-Amphidinium_carterae.1
MNHNYSIATWLCHASLEARISLQLRCRVGGIVNFRCVYSSCMGLNPWKMSDSITYANSKLWSGVSGLPCVMKGNSKRQQAGSGGYEFGPGLAGVEPLNEGDGLLGTVGSDEVQAVGRAMPPKGRTT